MYHGTMSRLKTAHLEEEEEALGIVWDAIDSGATEKDEITRILHEGISGQVFDRLEKSGSIAVDGGRVKLTPAGRTLAESVVRRHRLAERLLVDVLGMGSESVDANACLWEHVLSCEAATAICTLLGHPRQCPHGSAIPPGECCKNRQLRVEPVLCSLNRLPPGKTGRVAYLALEDRSTLQKLLALGLSPGSEVTLKQTEPAVVVQSGETVIALEADLARRVFVKR